MFGFGFKLRDDGSRGDGRSDVKRLWIEEGWVDDACSPVRVTPCFDQKCCTCWVCIHVRAA